MAITQPFPLSRTSQDAFIQYHKYASTNAERQWSLKDRMRDIDLAYLREQDDTSENQKAKLANTYGDSNKIQNITIPVIKPQVRAAVAYQAAIFLTDYPLFGVVSDPQYMDAAKQFQAVIEENSIHGGWVRELLLFFQDGFKYNLSAIEVTWEKINVATLETDLSFQGGLEGKPKTIIWQGNKIRRLDPYNMYFDSRIEPYLIPTEGEFAGYTKLMSRTALKSFIQSLDTKIIENIKPAFESPSLLNSGMGEEFGASYYLPRLNPGALIDVSNNEFVDWAAWMQNVSTGNKAASINYRGIYEVSIEYVRVIPTDFNLKVPAPNTPQVWKLIIVNHTIVVYAERQTNAHDKIPIFFGCPGEDGLAYQSKSLATDAQPFQQVSSALMNSILAARRRAVTDRTLYDPSRVSEAHINNPNPAAKIPVRPAAYGKPVGESVYQFPFRDDQAGLAMQEIQAVVQFGNVLNGQNPARQGQFVKGNKTDGQWETTMSNATSQDQITALLYEAQVFTPVKEVLKINMLQFQQSGEIYSQSQEQNVQIDPLVLRKAILQFKITDGILPAEKVISTDSLQIAMQVIGSSQTLASGYNIGPMFSYIMKTENVNLAPFEKSQPQQMYEQAMGSWSQVAQLSIQKGVPFNQPQPLPEQFGFDPASVDPRNGAGSQPASQSQSQ
jgi:hypothetical protein